MDETQKDIQNAAVTNEKESTSPPPKRMKIAHSQSQPTSTTEVDTLHTSNEIAKNTADALQSKGDPDSVENGEPNSSTVKTLKKNTQYNLRKKKTKRTKHDSESSSDLKVQFENEIDELLEEKSWKNNLSAINVKSILRHVITNEHVLAMVRNTMEEETQTESPRKSIEEAVYEPKLTRSKAKELIEKNANVPWPISPIKKPKTACKLMETEFSEEENSSDEEYTPEADEEADLEKSINSQLDDSIEKPPSPPSEPTIESTDDQSRETDAEILTHSSLASLTESFQQLSAGDTIACRTRSKLPLTDTPLESIESSFIAPDITTDMYDSDCDDEDWVSFLQQIVQTPTDVGDDEAEDPEYNFLEDNEELDREDLRDDRAVKITKKELSELITETFEAADLELGEFEDDDENSKNIQSTDFARSMASKVVDERDSGNCDSTAVESYALIGPTERLQLEEQMRKHVQLLVQGFILSSSVEEYQDHRDEYTTLLIELQAFAIQNKMSKGCPSAFNACNLIDGVQLVANYRESFSEQDCEERRKLRLKRGPGLTYKAKTTMSQSKVLIYPELLPICGFSTAFSKMKVCFSEAEDNLLAMGLNQFYELKDLPLHKTIRDNMLPVKTETQIRHRIKNLKSPKAFDNPVKTFFNNKCVLPPQPVKIPPEFNSNDVKPPKKQSLSLLPFWLRKLVQPKSEVYPIPILPKTSPSKDAVLPTSTIDPTTVIEVNESATAPLTSIPRTPEKNPIVPSLSNNRISPLKQISPILKKYSPNRFKKTGGNLRKPKPILPKTPVFYISPTKDGQRKIAPKETNDDKSSEISSEQNQTEEMAETLQIHCRIMGEQLEVLPEQPEKGSKAEEHFQETDSQSDVELFDDEEEPLDNAADLAALMAASTTIQTAPRGKQGMGKRCSRLQRDTHAKLQLLASDLLESDPLREERENAFAQSYLMKVKEVTKNKENVYECFLKLLYEFGQSEKPAVQLYGDVCKLLKDFPALCNEFVAFLLPEQAMQCGKLLEYLQFKQMRLFLRKLEIHFDKNPQHIQKVLKALAQCQEHINLGLDSIKNIIQPLFRGRAHLLEEFLQLFPTESASENMMTDYEEITLPDSDGEMEYDGYETITLPEDKHDFGGKNCKCHCHTESQDLKLQKRIRHCIPCGTKFIDGRIYIQTGKSLRPARVVYLDSEKSSQSTFSHSMEQEPVEPSSPCSESSSVSSLSPTDLKDSEEENITSQTEYPNRPLPSDAGTEDAILTPDTSSSISEIPPNFSGLGSVLAQEIQKNNSEITEPEVSTTSQSKTQESIDGLTLSAKNHSVNEHGHVVVLWTKAADRFILETCRQLGVTDVAFQIVSHDLGNKSVGEVRERFSELIRLYSMQSSDLSGSESEAEEAT